MPARRHPKPWAVLACATAGLPSSASPSRSNGVGPLDIDGRACKAEARDDNRLAALFVGPARLGKPAVAPCSAAHRGLLGSGRLMLPLVMAWVLTLCTSLPARAASSEELAARREQVAGMQPADQQELLRKFERFRALPREEQQRLRALQESIDADPRSKELHEVLDRYHEWLKTLTPAERADLADLPPKERVEKVQRIQQRQQAARERAHQAELLTRTDVREIIRWAEALAWKHREQLISQMPEKYRKSVAKSSTERQKQMLPRTLFFARRPGGSSRLTLVEEGDVDRLAKKLSPAAKDELMASGDLAAQRKKLAGWVGTALTLETWHGRGRFGPAIGDNFVQFLEHEVPLDMRERLLKKMQPDELRGEVWRMYMQRERGGRPSWPSDGPLDGGKPTTPKTPPEGEAGSSEAEAAKP